MSPIRETYPALHLIFTLLNAIRRGVERKNIWREFRRQGIALQPRLVFWVALCKQAGLVKVDDGLHVTGYAKRWLDKPSDEQAIHLIEAWQNAPKNRRVRMFRRKLLWKLKYGKLLTQKDRGALNGLEALGLVAVNGQLTSWGRFFIKGEGDLPTPKPVSPCQIIEEHFTAHLPQHLALLWELESYLRPKSPGIYPLTKRALHLYVGDPYGLIDLLERGLRKPMPENIKAVLLRQPSIRITEGIVLEFSSPAELKQLRRQPVFRAYIAEFLSPQRILVSSDKAKGLFKMLSRRGAYLHKDQEQVEVRRKRTHFPQFTPQTPMKPVGRHISKIDMIEKYRELQQALDVSYRVPGYAAEQRRITPLIIEERGEHMYVIAYCQTRRAQRTFRLDRIEVPGTW